MTELEVQVFFGQIHHAIFIANLKYHTLSKKLVFTNLFFSMATQQHTQKPSATITISITISIYQSSSATVQPQFSFHPL